MKGDRFDIPRSINFELFAGVEIGFLQFGRSAGFKFYIDTIANVLHRVPGEFGNGIKILIQKLISVVILKGINAIWMPFNFIKWGRRNFPSGGIDQKIIRSSLPFFPDDGFSIGHEALSIFKLKGDHFFTIAIDIAPKAVLVAGGHQAKHDVAIAK